MKETRTYKSDLRDAQAKATRDRILDALVEVLAEGVDALSIPAVAKRAGVSVGTVYRHFGDKAGLLEALIPHAGRRAGIGVERIPESLEEVDEVVHKVFRNFEGADGLLRAAFASRIGRDLRVQGSPERLDLLRQSFGIIEPDLGPAEREHLAKLALILTTSEAYQQWTDRLGLSPDEAADEVMWAIRVILKGLQR